MSYQYYRKMRLSTIEKRRAANPNKRGRTPLFDYPFEQMTVGDSVVFGTQYQTSYPTIQRAASRYGSRLSRLFSTKILNNGDLGIERIA